MTMAPGPFPVGTEGGDFGTSVPPAPTENWKTALPLSVVLSVTT
jgi:hypothetical protein